MRTVCNQSVEKVYPLAYSFIPLVHLVNLYKYILKRRVAERFSFNISVKINGPKNAQLKRLNLAIEFANSITVKQYASWLKVQNSSSTDL